MHDMTHRPTVELARSLRNRALACSDPRERAVLLDGVDYLYTLAKLELGSYRK